MKRADETNAPEVGAVTFLPLNTGSSSSDIKEEVSPLVARRWKVWLTILAFLFIASAHGAANTRADVDIAISGLDDNQELSGTVSFTIDVGTKAAYVYAYANPLPLRENTSYLVGQWSTTRSRSITVKLDTKFLPDGVHAFTVYTRDSDYRLVAIRAFTVAVKNFTRADYVASYMEIERPRHMESQRGAALEIKVRDLGITGVDSYSYRVTPLGFARADDIVSKEGRVSMAGEPTGWYAVTVWAYDAAGQAIDKSTVTVYFESNNTR